MPDSSTAGYLQPTSINNELNDDALADFLQSIVVGITGLPGPMVRPRWQDEPPNPPDPGINWAAIGPGQYGRDWDSAQIKQDDGSILMIRNRTMEIVCSFYGPNAQATLELLANGLDLPQNREQMQLSGFALVGGMSPPILAPAIYKGKWYKKYDATFAVRQQQQYTYSILDLTAAQATLEVQPPGQAVINTSINVTAP